MWVLSLSPRFFLYPLSFLLLPDSVYSQCEKVRGTLGPWRGGPDVDFCFLADQQMGQLGKSLMDWGQHCGFDLGQCFRAWQVCRANGLEPSTPS